MGMCGLCKVVLSVLLIVLNVLGFLVGAVLMSLAAWQWTSYVDSPAFFDSIFGDSRQILIFFMSSGAALLVLSVIGILAGLASIFTRLRYLAALLLVLYTAVLFAIYTLEVITVSLDFSQYFASKGQVGANIKGAFLSLLSTDLGFNSSAASWIDTVQSGANCCGYYNGSDYGWTQTAQYHSTKWPLIFTDGGVYRPRSCCDALNTTMNTHCNQWQPTYHTDGCALAFVSVHQKITWSFLGISIAAAAIEALVLILPLFLIGLVLSAKCGRKEEKE